MKSIFTDSATAYANRKWLVYMAGYAGNILDASWCYVNPAQDTRYAIARGSRIPRSLRHHIKHPSWSIDPNYVKFRGHVREGRRAVKRWRKDPAYKLIKIVREA